MSERRVCLDLFSGLGGFSAAFADADGWDVRTVDLDPEERFDPDLRADVLELRPADLLDLVGEYDALVVLASPPCDLFSVAGNHDAWNFQTREPQNGRAREAIALVFHTVGLIRSLSPDYWFLENPCGRLRWYLGPPTGMVTYCQYGEDYQKRTDLWGNHPSCLTYRKCSNGQGCHSANREWDGTGATDPLGKDKAERSLVPYNLSEAIREACDAALDGDAHEQATLPGVGDAPPEVPHVR